MEDQCLQNTTNCKTKSGDCCRSAQSLHDRWYRSALRGLDGLRSLPNMCIFEPWFQTAFSLIPTISTAGSLFLSLAYRITSAFCSISKPQLIASPSPPHDQSWASPHTSSTRFRCDTDRAGLSAQSSWGYLPSSVFKIGCALRAAIEHWLYESVMHTFQNCLLASFPPTRLRTFDPPGCSSMNPVISYTLESTMM